MTSQLKVALIRKLRGSLMYLAYFFDMSSLGVCTTRHWQTSTRLVQELNVYTVCSLIPFASWQVTFIRPKIYHFVNEYFSNLEYVEKF